MPANVSTFTDYLLQERTFRSDQEKYFSTLFSISCTFVVLGAVENIIVCCVLVTGKIGRSPTKLSNFFILHLSIADLVFRSITFLRRTLKHHENLDPSSTVHCQLVIFSHFTCAAVTFVLLTGIAIDRYVHILFPLRALTLKTRKYLIVIFIWFYALVICSGFIVSASLSPRIKLRAQLYFPSNSSSNLTSNDTAVSPDSPFHRHCTPGRPDSLERKVAFTVYFVFAFVVPLIVITFAYTKITVFLWKRTKMNNSMNSSSCAKTKLKATQMLVLVVFSFLISWGPIMILDICASYPTEKGRITYQKLPLRPLFDCISLTSSIFYPFIYAFCDANFRKNLRRCLCRKDSVRVTRVSPVIIDVSYIQMSNLSPKVARDSTLSKRAACNFTYNLKPPGKHLT